MKHHPQFNRVLHSEPASARLLNKKELEGVISDCRDKVNEACTEESRELWAEELEKFKELSVNQDYVDGLLPQGIDELIIEMIEWRSMIYALQRVETKRNAFEESAFFAQWYLGAIYGVFSIFGKLLSKDSRDNSLRKLWQLISPIMLEDGACLKQETDYINGCLSVKTGLFTNDKSKAMLFRNKFVSHNEATPKVVWEDIDRDISVLIRMWSLLVSWSSFGIVHPFRDDSCIFLGTEAMFDDLEVKTLLRARQEYLDMVAAWSKTYAHSGEVDKGRGAFANLKVKIKSI
ncbi:hypothetical protein QQF40_06465 [Cobetia sp. LC6]|uniref:hypothetical protein n=1 Tax=Cobetia sp. LC6 TaxID=3050947 RepID=UPI0025534935|nr:hypothetical protein [Cobetia sp. LC6]MDL2191031.1 hypothetical protein [Cobetia sp. LC6]